MEIRNNISSGRDCRVITLIAKVANAQIDRRSNHLTAKLTHFEMINGRILGNTKDTNRKARAIS
jgi:hypothetical protein